MKLNTIEEDIPLLPIEEEHETSSESKRERFGGTNEANTQTSCNE